MIAHINIGTNLGHRVDNIDRAVSLLGRRVGRVAAVSSPVKSPAQGFDSANEFLNVGVNVETILTPIEVLSNLKEIEQEIAPGESHRNASGGYADRTIDLDLICMGEERVGDFWLTLPHPRLSERDFVLRPMAEILGDWRHPLSGLTAEKMLENLCNKTGCPDVKIL